MITVYTHMKCAGNIFKTLLVCSFLATGFAFADCESQYLQALLTRPEGPETAGFSKALALIREVKKAKLVDFGGGFGTERLYKTSHPELFKEPRISDSVPDKNGIQIHCSLGLNREAFPILAEIESRLDRKKFVFMSDVASYIYEQNKLNRYCVSSFYDGKLMEFSEIEASLSHPSIPDLEWIAF